MSKISPFLWFDGRLEEAVQFYTSIFTDSKVENLVRMPDGKVMHATFVLAGQRVLALDGGPQYKPTEAFSFFVSCETQEEVDYYWSKLTEGGAESRCGWLKDKFGLSWQIIPTALGRCLGDKDPQKAQRAMQAMLQMKKIDIAALEKATAG